MMTSKELVKALAGKRVLWRPSCGDGYGYNDLLVEDQSKGFMPEVWLRTEDRFSLSETVPPDGTEIESSEEENEIRRVYIKHGKELQPLDGFRGVLHMSDPDRPESDLGRVVQFQVTCDTRHYGRITRTVIFAAVESLEFAMRFLIPHDIRVQAIYQQNYYVGFNACLVPGGFMRRIARVLGARWYLSDDLGLQAVGECEKVFQAFPCLRAFSDVELYPFPIRYPFMDSDNNDPNKVRSYIVGATPSEAESLAAEMVAR